MPRAPAATDLGVCHGDRALFLGIGRRHGKQGDVSSPRRELATLRFDDGASLLVRIADLHVVPRRPKPDF